MTSLTMELLNDTVAKIRALPPAIRKIRCSYAEYWYLEQELPHLDMFDPYLEPGAYIPGGFLVLEYTDDHIEVVLIQEARTPSPNLAKREV